MTEEYNSSRCRKKTNSITHLVKIVAEETVKECINRQMKDAVPIIIEECVSKIITSHKLNSTLHKRADEFLSNVQSSCEKAGQTWTDEEDSMLTQELRAAVAQIAKNHNRSMNAVKCRIEDQDLLKEARS